MCIRDRGNLIARAIAISDRTAEPARLAGLWIRWAGFFRSVSAGGAYRAGEAVPRVFNIIWGAVLLLVRARCRKRNTQRSLEVSSASWMGVLLSLIHISEPTR